MTVLKEVDLWIIFEAFRKHNGNSRETAYKLNIYKSTILRKMKNCRMNLKKLKEIWKR